MISINDNNKKHKKVTWDEVYVDFRKQHLDTPSKEIAYWGPYGYAAIKILYTDGEAQIYNYNTKELEYI